MTKLISGRVKKVGSANVSSTRYDYIKLSETEPDLGLPAANGYVLSANTDGTRRWVLPISIADISNIAITVSANLSLNSINDLADVDTATVPPSTGYGLVWNGTKWVPNVITVSSTELANIANVVVSIVAASITANNAAYANLASFANIATLAYFANSAGNVLTLSNFTTSNLSEGVNLYYTNARARTAISAADSSIEYNPVTGTIRATSNISANIADALSTITTANVAEAASNLYYTNARAVAAVVNTTLSNLTVSGNVVTGNIIAGSGFGGSITGANLISANYIQGNIWQGIYTANVIESASNLYFTNARVYANVAPLLALKANVVDLTTANVIESASNLYYTNARVYANVVGFLPSLAGNGIIIAANGQISANTSAILGSISNITGNLAIGGNLNVTQTITAGNIITGSGIGGSITGANLISANYIQGNIWQGIYTANVIESTSNLYFTNARVYANVAQLLTSKANVTDLTTANVIESASNLYYTNARVYANVVTLLATKANVTDLTTANVRESTGNLYYTNARVYANVIALLPTLAGNNISISANGQISANLSAVSVSINSVTGNLNVSGNVIANAFIAGSSAGSGLISSSTDLSLTAVGNINLSAGNLLVAGNLSVTQTITAGNIIAGGGSGGSITGANLIGANYIQGNNWLGLYTANVIESASNLYYTNARSRAAISAGNGISYNPNTGVISSIQDLTTTGTVTFANLTVTGQTNFYGNVTTHTSNNLSVSDNMIYLNSGSESSNPDLGFAGNYNDGVYRHAGFFRDASDSGTWKVFENYSPEPDANIFIDTNHATFRLANLSATTFIGNVQGTVSTLSNFSTSNLAEGANLYYTNARVYANVINLLNAKANVTDLTTANVLESTSNLYYTNNRVYANVIALLSTLAGNNISIAANGQISANLSGATASINSVTGNLNVSGNVIANAFIAGSSAGSGLISSSTDLTLTAVGNINLSAGNLLVAGNLSVTQTITAGNIIAGGGSGGSITGANLIGANYIQGNIWQGIYTANVIESVSNLYYTNNRVYANVIALLPTLAGNGIIIAANGQISANAAAITGSLSNLTGNVSVTGNLRVTNGITANSIRINGVEIVTGDETATNLNATNVRVNLVASNIWSGIYTANVIESTGNLYFTNARVYSNVIALLPTLAGDNITVAANGRISANLSNATFSNISGNITVTGNINATGSIVANSIGIASSGAPTVFSDSNITLSAINGTVFINSQNTIATGNITTSQTIYANSLVIRGNEFVTGNENSTNLNATNVTVNAITANVWNRIYTANVLETSGNLYYTNTRVYANVLALLPTLAGNNISIAANGQISANTSSIVSSISSLTGNITVTGNLLVTNGITANSIRIFGNEIVSGNEASTNLNATNVNVTAITANVWNGIYTANVIESVSNLYYTNTRVYSNVIALLTTLAGNNISIAANGRISAAVSSVTGNLTVSGNLIANGLVIRGIDVTETVLAGNIVSGTSLSNVITANTITATGNITAGNVIANAFISTGPGTGSISSPGDFAINAVGNIILNANNLIANNFVSTGIGSSFITSTSNLSITAPNVITSGNFIVNGTFVSSNINATNISATVWSGIYTSNIIESGNVNTGNVFFTNTRARAAFIAGGNITIDANGVISSTAGISNAISNVTSNLTVTGNILAGNVIANAFISTGPGTGSISSPGDFAINAVGNIILNANNLIANNFVSAGVGSSFITSTSNLSITAPNVVVTSTNFIVSGNITAANFIGNVSASITNLNNFTTSNLNEGSNLYFTNARVVTAIVNSSLSNLTVTGNISAGNILTGTGLGGSITGANLISANYIQGNIIAGNLIAGGGGGGYITGANLIGANYIQGNIWQGIYTANVIESTSNLYFTNARVYANVAPLLTSKANVTDLTTANVIESTSNLYFTNSRVYTNVIALLPTLAGNNIIIAANGQISANLSGATASINSVTGNLNVTGNVIANAFVAGSGAGSGSISSSTDLTLYAAGNINLYGGNVVANTFVSTSVGAARLSSTGDIILTTAGNISLSATGNVLANSAILTRITANIWQGIYTANVIESAANLYYTNARVYANVVALLPTLAGNNIIIAANGQISANLSAVSVNNITGNLNVTGNVIANAFVAGSGAGSGSISSSTDLTLTAAGNINLYGGNVVANTFVSTGTGTARLSSTGDIILTTAGNISLNATGNVLANSAILTRITANIWNGLYTSNVLESAANLYYTNSRVFSALSGGTGVNYSNTTGVISIGQNVATTANVTFAQLNVTGVTNFYGNVITHSSNNLSIADNMIYLNSDSTSSNPDLGFAGNYNDGTYRHAGFFRDASDAGTWKVFENYSPEPDANIFIDTANATFRLANIAATQFIGNIVGTLGTFAGNVIAGNLISGGGAGGSITGANLISANYIQGNIWQGIYTANVIETTSNLYYTNTRTYANVITLLPTLAGNNISIAANGQISANFSTVSDLRSVRSVSYTFARIFS